MLHCLRSPSEVLDSTAHTHTHTHTYTHTHRNKSKYKEKRIASNESYRLRGKRSEDILGRITSRSTCETDRKEYLAEQRFFKDLRWKHPELNLERSPEFEEISEDSFNFSQIVGVSQRRDEHGFLELLQDSSWIRLNLALCGWVSVEWVGGREGRITFQFSQLGTNCVLPQRNHQFNWIG